MKRDFPMPVPNLVFNEVIIFVVNLFFFRLSARWFAPENRATTADFRVVGKWRFAREGQSFPGFSRF